MPGKDRVTRIEGMMRGISYLYKQPEAYWIPLGFIVVALVGVLEHLVGRELFFSIFYLIPISLVTWFTARWVGIMVSIISAMVWLLADFTSGHTYSHPAIPYWNMSVRLLTFLVVTFILSALKSTLEDEKELARTDPLTGIANRRYFIELANIEINRARRYKHPFTVVHIDLDNFKTVNDRFGHTTGDSLLRLVANTIQNNIRATDTVARLGGDEFAILLPETGAGPAQVITEKTQKINLEVMQRNGWPVSFSIGAVTFLNPPSTVDEILKISDGLMYAAKNNGKNIIKHNVFCQEEKDYQ
jgi:diguanylate cyclase (GGDEF)-like protein